MGSAGAKRNEALGEEKGDGTELGLCIHIGNEDVDFRKEEAWTQQRHQSSQLCN